LLAIVEFHLNGLVPEFRQRRAGIQIGRIRLPWRMADLAIFICKLFH